MPQVYAPTWFQPVKRTVSQNGSLSSDEETACQQTVSDAHVRKLIARHPIRHVGIIMDGNRRWARSKGLPGSMGHLKGVESFKHLVRACSNLGLPYLTAYAFSTENWRRSPEEVTFLMQLIADSLRQELNELHAKRVRIRLMGATQGLPPSLLACLQEAVELTKDNNGLTLQLAINYGGRQEVTEAVRALAQQVAAGTLSPEAITSDLISQQLYHPDSGDPDIIIRPGGECRISNFLLWQSAYAEIAVSPVMWPEFTPDVFKCTLVDVCQRQRRFGK